ncbi:unnamed protein product [Citrullus colocynthis]|uniref:Secreted protein n=1 Tax=Citrullus colocynthis TaxID=252529 RepID=A0ABP0Z0E1_9ROSI
MHFAALSLLSSLSDPPLPFLLRQLLLPRRRLAATSGDKRRETHASTTCTPYYTGSLFPSCQPCRLLVLLEIHSGFFSISLPRRSLSALSSLSRRDNNSLQKVYILLV